MVMPRTGWGRLLCFQGKKTKKEIQLQIKEEENVEYYRLMVLSSSSAGRFVSDSCALTAFHPPPSQEEVMAATLQL